MRAWGNCGNNAQRQLLRCGVAFDALAFENGQSLTLKAARFGVFHFENGQISY
jgi:hypothetical protein